MTINLKNYQEKAVDELIATFKKLLVKEEQKKVCVFQAPTGSGKTLMTAKFIDEIIKEVPEMDLCFVWISIGKGELHLQSKHSLERVFGGFPRVSLVEEEFTGGRERIVRNEVVVVNWEKLRSKYNKDEGSNKKGDWKNTLMKDGENLNFRDVLSKTREQRKVIMIIDESHIGATAERTNELREEINADVILEMSATPKIAFSPAEEKRGTAGFVLVEPKDVIDEGMIKKELIINEKVDEITDDEADSQEVILQTAYKKRLALKNLFEKEGANINPLVLVQIPTAEAGDDKIKAVKKFLFNKGITERKAGIGNGKLAIWLSEQKSETLDWISEPDNEIEYLIFKQAIDTGWDCPRAHILVKFRESHSETFEIQTVGRILRMPEQKHYSIEDLNRGYIYTNVQSIIVKKEEYNPNIIKHLKAVRKNVYEPIELVSYYKSRADYGDITSSFSSVFEKVACGHFNLNSDYTMFDQNVKKLESKGCTIDIKKYKQNLVKDLSVVTDNFDYTEGIIISDQNVSLNLSDKDIENLFYSKIIEKLGSFKSTKRSLQPVKTAIYSWFRKYLGARQWDDQLHRIQCIVLANYSGHFSEILVKAVEEYAFVKSSEVRSRVEQSEQWYSFEIPYDAFFNQYTDERIELKAYLYNPCYLNIIRSEPEKDFEDFLETNIEKVIWWWKNGENKKDYFGIKYEYPINNIHTFYPDYLVKLKDGRLGIFETKSVSDREGNSETKAKSEALAKYINDNKDKKIFGGIAIEKDSRWIINSKNLYDWDKCLMGNWSDWDRLAL